MGNIGQALAKRAAALDMRVLRHSAALIVRSLPCCLRPAFCR
jgi:phosphoglycerate dehydrogenase-like enzyme